MSNFDPAAFMHAQVEGSSATRYEPVPEGEYGPCVIDGVRGVTIGQDASPALTVTYEIDSQELREQLDREKVTVRQTIFLDLLESGALDMGKGKNVQLGRLREAVNQNSPSKPWGPAMLEGAGPVTIVVAHRVNDDDPTVVYDGVRAVKAFGQD